ncbi:MAG: hypothetical protein ACREOG_06505, partial [Gemmatimonadaceae bacterium]
MRRKRHVRRCAFTALFLTYFGQQAVAQQPGGQPQQAPAPQPPRFQYVGPASAGRIAAAAGIPGDT